MAFATGYITGFSDTYFANLSEVAALARSKHNQRDATVGQFYGVPDYVAAYWIRVALDQGYDVGRPRGVR